MRRLLILIAASVSSACAATPDALPDRIDRATLVRTFDEDFARPPTYYDAALAPNGRWKTNYFFSEQRPGQPKSWEARTLRPNQEAEYYGDPLRGTNPFAWRPGEFTIVARPNPFGADPATHGLPYLSGLVTTEKSFSQRYGYFEARVAMPCGKGLWPAFWLLPEPDVRNGHAIQSGQQEIDVFENIGPCDELYLTDHRDVAGKKVGTPEKIGVAPVDRFHTYGLMLTPTSIGWYIDDRKVRERPNVDFRRPAYILLDLAVGGKWPGYPDATTRFPAKMRIEWVRAYRLPSISGP